MGQPLDNVDYDEKDERNMIVKNVDGRLRLLEIAVGRIKILKRSDERLNGRTKVFKKPYQMFWLL